MAKFLFRNNVYDTDVIASMEELKRPLSDLNGGEPITHVMYWKEEYIRHPSMRKGKFLNEQQALEIGAACLRSNQLPMPEVRSKSRKCAKTQSVESPSNSRAEIPSRVKSIATPAAVLPHGTFAIRVPMNRRGINKSHG